ncbi:hypothetical protein [Rufibacter roseus]|uniref:Photosystem I assembly protein Ycf4 n=2 Tax=Rufibacter roseus TaxID=1567108 RepID=A0ABW2DMT7_9BACT|nr:hypothetical protein [Rufibacter roseus]
MNSIETYKAQYYVHKFGSLLFGCSFFFGGLSTLLKGGAITINEVPTKATFENVFPFLFIGGCFIGLFFWICFKYFRVSLTDAYVKKQLVFGSKYYSWEDFEEIEEVNPFRKGIIFKFKPKGERAFYAQGDKPVRVFTNPLNSKWYSPTVLESKMENLIDIKKRKMNI